METCFKKYLEDKEKAKTVQKPQTVVSNSRILIKKKINISDGIPIIYIFLN